MTSATKRALLEVSRILHEAGWDSPSDAAGVKDAEALAAEIDQQLSVYAPEKQKEVLQKLSSILGQKAASIAV